MEIVRETVSGDLQNDRIVLHVLLEQLPATPQMFAMFEDIADILEHTECSVLVLDLERVHYATSSFFAKLVGLNEKCAKRGVELRLCCMGEHVLDAFKVLKLDTLIKLYATQEEALA